MLTSSPAPPEIASALDRGERVLWSGQPRQGLTLRGVDIFVIPFSLLWGGIPTVAGLASAQQGEPFGALVAVPFGLIGIYLLVGRFFVDAAQRRRTFYALTNERIVIVSGLWSQNVNSLSLRTLDQIDVSSRANGRGTISFGRSPYGSFAVPGWPGMDKFRPAMFEMISGAVEVGRLIRDAQRAATAPTERA
jgi:hypothetical protein